MAGGRHGDRLADSLGGVSIVGWGTMPYARIEVYRRRDGLLEKIGEGEAVYTDAARPMPYPTHTAGAITANIYCNKMLVGRLEGRFTDTVAAGAGGVAEKVITFKVVIQ